MLITHGSPTIFVSDWAPTHDSNLRQPSFNGPASDTVELSRIHGNMEGSLAEKGTLRLSVDGAKCQGHNRCCALAPELFEADELGFAVVKGGGLVPATLEQKALLAVRNCPEYAIRAERE